MRQRKTINRDVNAAQRARLAITLRARKMTYPQIAAQCGYGSAASAYKAVQRELERTIVEDVEELRREEALLLDEMQSICYELAVDRKNPGRLFAVDRLLAISERRSRLMGLDKGKDDVGVFAGVVIREVPQGYLGDDAPGQESQAIQRVQTS